MPPTLVFPDGWRLVRFNSAQGSMKKWLFIFSLIVFFFLPCNKAVSFAFDFNDNNYKVNSPLIWNYITYDVGSPVNQRYYKYNRNFVFNSSDSNNIIYGVRLNTISPDNIKSVRTILYSNSYFYGDLNMLYWYSDSFEGLTGNGSTGGSGSFTSSSYKGIYYYSAGSITNRNLDIISDDSILPLVYDSSVESFLDYIVNNGGLPDGSIPDDIDMGYLSNVKYFVDSSSLQYNPNNTPEWISWGYESTTGVDLSDSRYQVEFAIEDQSSYYVNRHSDYVSQYGYNPISNIGLWTLEARDYIKSLITPFGDNRRAVLQGKSINTSFYGKFLSAGTTPASNRQYKISAVNRYINALSTSDTDENSFRSFLTGYSDNPSNGLIGHMAQNISNLGRLYSLSYNFYARIVDTTTGAKGDWLKIDRHNTPYWDIQDEDTLNGRITVNTGIKVSIPDMSDQRFNSPNEVVEPEPNEGMEPLGTGYVNPVTGNGDVTYKNTYYIYNNTYNTNNINGGDVNNFTYIDKDSKTTNGSDSLMESIGLLGIMTIAWSWYEMLFGDLLPIWARVCIPVFMVIFSALTVWKLRRVIFG